MELNRLELFVKILNATNINVNILKNDQSNLELIDKRFRLHLYQNYIYDGILDLLESQKEANLLFRITDDFLFTYFFLHIPEEYISEDETTWISVGPLSEGRRSPDDIYHIVQKNRIPERLFQEISSFYDTVPVIESVSQYGEFIQELASGLFSRTYRLEYLPADCVLFCNSASIYKTVRDNPQMAMTSIAERYEVENELMLAISAGDYEKAHSLHGKFLTYHIRPRTENPLHNQQHLSIILNTLCRKAAEAGGVHPLYIDELSTRFAVLIHEVYSIGDVSALSREMIHKYCLLVKNHAMKGYSAVTKEIISYIDFHYMEDLTLNRLAEMFNISKTYLSNLFRRETGVTLTEYIHQVRMRKAITLINSSALPVAAIATACGYNDINYFTRIFKRTYGLSPKQYQKSVMHGGV